MLDKCIQPDTPTGWKEIISKRIWEWRGRSLLKATICNLAWGAAVYNMWRKRNRVMGNGKFKATNENVAICSSWGISQNILF